jgi:hypothetical protein
MMQPDAKSLVIAQALPGKTGAPREELLDIVEVTLTVLQ